MSISADVAVDQAMRTYYRRRAAEYDEWYRRLGRYNRGASDSQWHAELGELDAWVEGLRASRVLEIACGTGRWTGRLARRSRVVACDFAPEMLAQCARACTAADVEIAMVRADAYALPFATGVFDAVFFGFWLSHVFPRRRPVFMAEVGRVLRPGGEVWVCDSGWSVDSGARDHAPPPAVEEGGVHERRLNDGSVHQIYKQCFTAPKLAAYLRAWGAEPEVNASREHFVWGRVRVEG